MKYVPDLVILSGVLCLSYGAWLVYEPAGFIVFGALAVFAGARMAR